MFRARDRIEVKTPEQIELMRAAGLVVAGALAVVHAQPLAKNGHKVPMTRAAVERALMRLVPA